MSVKEFFKSNVFKCIAALLCVLLVSGGFLTIAYGFLEVTEGERLNRAVSGIYEGKEVSVYGLDDSGNELLIDSSVSNPQGLLKEKLTIGSAEIQQAYKVVYTEDEKEVLNYLVSSLGKGGYSGGSITCWVALTIEDNEISGIYKIQISTNASQTLMSDINGSSLLKDIAEAYETDKYYVPDKTNSEFIVSGATMSSTAVCNSVNGAIAYVRTEVLNEEITYPYSGFNYTQYIDVANPDSSYTVENGVVTYSIVTTSNGNAGAFTLEIKVKEGGKITAYEIKENGSNPASWADKMMPEIKDGTFFTADGGKDAAALKAVLGENAENTSLEGLETGASSGREHATKSNYLCIYAALFATSNYENCIAAQAQGGNA